MQVKPRKQPQSIGCGKTFRGASALRAFPTVHTWLGELGKELEERIGEDRDEHARLPRLLTVVQPDISPVVSNCSFTHSTVLAFGAECSLPAAKVMPEHEIEREVQNS